MSFRAVVGLPARKLASRPQPGGLQPSGSSGGGTCGALLKRAAALAQVEEAADGVALAKGGTVLVPPPRVHLRAGHRQALSSLFPPFRAASLQMTEKVDARAAADLPPAAAAVRRQPAGKCPAAI
jgi:hypothetical protein